MDFRIADTFTDSLAKLTGDEQKAAKTTAFDLQLDPANPGMKFHKLDKAKDKRFWSVRVSSDLRLIVHRSDESLLLCYVDHHDKAYHWAERRKLETHPKTGAAQLVVVRETVKDVIVPHYIEEEVAVEVQSKPPIFADRSDDEFLAYGVPAEWLDDVRQANEDSLLALVEHLPKEAGEALLELATGGTPAIPEPVAAGASPFEHPDAQRRFRVMTNVEELQLALDYPWEKWTVFLHPDQRRLVERDFNGAARVAGSAGTGKTVVAIHRAVHLARKHRDARILLTTFSDPLAQALQTKLYRLAGSEPLVLERIEVCSIDDVGNRLYAARFGKPNLVDDTTVRKMLEAAAADSEESRFSDRFIWSEWCEVVDAWQLHTWESYRGISRLGRKSRLGEKQRKTLWGIFSAVRKELDAKQLITQAAVFHRVTEHVAQNGGAPYTYTVIDEAQDIGVPDLRMLAVIASSQEDGLFFAGDLGQRIFQPPFSWKQLGVDVRGRSSTLRINYRTSHQIRSQADRLLPGEMADVDGNSEKRKGTVSVFNGPEPQVLRCSDERDEAMRVGEWLKQLVEHGVYPSEIGVFVRSPEQMERAARAIESAGLAHKELTATIKTLKNHVALGTMHLAKGLEFKAVAVISCDDEVLPLQERIEAVSDDADLEDVYNTERHLLYVACTRARDHLLVSCVEPGSEFLDDLEME